MGERSKPLDVIRSLPARVAAGTGIAGAVAALLISLQSATRPTLFVLAILALGALLFAALYVARANTATLLEGGKGFKRFPRLEKPAVGFILAVSGALFLVMVPSTPRASLWGWVFPHSSPRIEGGLLTRYDPSRPEQTRGSVDNKGYSMVLLVSNPSDNGEVISSVSFHGLEEAQALCAHPDEIQTFRLDENVSIRTSPDGEAVSGAVRTIEGDRESDYTAFATGHVRRGGESALSPRSNSASVRQWVYLQMLVSS